MVIRDKKRRIADGQFRQDFFHHFTWGSFLLGMKPKSMIQNMRGTNPKFREYHDSELERLLEDGVRETIAAENISPATIENIKKERQLKLELVDNFMN